MVKRKLSRSRKGEYTFTLTGLSKDHVRVLYSIFDNLQRHCFHDVTYMDRNGVFLPFEVFETLIPLGLIRVGCKSSSVAITNHHLLRDILDAFPCAFSSSIPLRESLFDFKTLRKL